MTHRSAIAGQGGGAGASWWDFPGQTCLAAYRAIGAESYAASLVNLDEPGTRDATEGAAPGWSADYGWRQTGSKYLKAGGITAAQVKTLAVRFANRSVMEINQALAGARNSVVSGAYGGVFLWASLSPETMHGYDLGSRVTVSSALAASGVMVVSGTVGYIDGDVDATGLAGASSATQAVYLMCGNNSDDAAYFATGDVLAVAIYSTVMSPAQVADLTAAMGAL